MLNLIKPHKLKKGDKVATVSLSWGGAGDEEILWRYYQGKERLENVFGLEVVEMPNTLKGSEYIYQHPDKRAEDLMAAFEDKSIKGIISCIGGDDSIRMLPYIDYKTIRNNPKIFTGFSDTTVTHFICLKAGISSFYGYAILTDFAENVRIPDYTINWVNKVLFNNDVIGNVPVSEEWTSQHLKWTIENKDIPRTFDKNASYELLQGDGVVNGNLIGGCFEVIELMKGTSLFPPLDCFDDAILFLETSEEQPPLWYLEVSLRNYGVTGIFNRINGILFAKPKGNCYYEEYKRVLKRVLAEFGRSDMPVLCNASFGHNEPKCCLPYGALAEINCCDITFSILESGTI